MLVDATVSRALTVTAAVLLIGTVDTTALYWVLVTELTCADISVAAPSSFTRLILAADVLAIKVKVLAAGLVDKLSCLLTPVPSNSTVLLCL